MYCENCGSKINDGVCFCPMCGKSIKKEVSELERELKKQNQKKVVVDRMNANVSFASNQEMAPVVSTWKFLFYRVITMIPIVGIIITLIFAFDKEDTNKANFAKSYFLGLLISIVIIVIFYSSIASILLNFIYSI